MNQFIIIGRGDDDREAKLCLLTRRVFRSYEEAQAFAAKDCKGNRDPQIVECYFPVPDSLYRGDWIAK